MPSVSPKGVDLYRQARCDASLLVGDLIYVSGFQSGLPVVAKVDRTSTNKMPSRGLVVQKQGATVCVYQPVGPVSGLYSGLTPNKPLFVGADGRITETVPSIPVSGLVVAQRVGWVVTAADIDLLPETNLDILTP